LKAVNDLSEDVRSEIEDIYFVLSELTNKANEDKKRNPIGFIQHVIEDK